MNSARDISVLKSYTDPFAAAPAPVTSKKKMDAEELAKVEETAKEFEAVFIAEMMKPMFEGITTDGPFGGGKGEEVFRGMLLNEYGKMVSKTGSIGLADHIKEQMILMQEQADSGTQNP